MAIPIDPSISRIFEKAMENRAPSVEECRRLLSLPERSLETGILTAVADHVSRRRFGNNAMLLGQIGAESAPCPGRCAFCAFGEGHSSFEKRRLSRGEILERARAFSEHEDLYALFLMTMHDVDFSWLVNIVSAVRRTLPRQTQIVVNTGDLEGSQGDELRSAGANGAYHIFRLREGTDTGLQPRQRLRSLEIIRKAGLDLYYCCEPAGPEHSPVELVHQMQIGIDFGCFQHGAMRRVHVPGTPLAARGQITERRLAQIAGAVTLATLGCKETKSICVHEANLLGLCAGANAIYAETGSNPRDTASDTEGKRGLSMRDCRSMLHEAGFTGLLYGDDAIPLSELKERMVLNQGSDEQAPAG